MIEQTFAGRPGSERRDCVVRALSIASGKPYMKVHAILAALGRKPGHRTSWRIADQAAEQLGLRVVPYGKSVATFLDDMQHVSRVAARVHGHAFGVVKGQVIDTDAPPRPRQVVTHYFIRKGQA